LTLLVPALLGATEPDDWSHPIPDSARWENPAEKIPEAAFFEVVASKQRAAEHRLIDREARALSDNEVAYFGGRDFRCMEHRSPYLIRARYENGGTGNFTIERFGQHLLVSHGSLGEPSGVKRSALVVCLDFRPAHVYTQLSGAM